LLVKGMVGGDENECPRLQRDEEKPKGSESDKRIVTKGKRLKKDLFLGRGKNQRKKTG